MVSCGDHITVENGRFLAHGVVIGAADPEPYPEPRIKVEIFRNKIDVPLSQVRLAPMDMIDEAVAGMPRQMLEDDYKAMGAKVAALQAENEGLLAVIDMQMSAITAAPPDPEDDVSNRVGQLQADHAEWEERLVDLLENYLVRVVGDRHPLRIADPDLRALVSHILD